MRLDYTGGKGARYIVSIYNWNVHDLLYFHDYREVKERYKKIIGQPKDKGTIVSLYDCIKDIRKEYTRF